PVEIVGVCGAEARNCPLRLAPGRGELRMSMSNADNLGKMAVEREVRRQVRRGTQTSVHNPSFQIANDNVRRRELFVGNAARLDRDKAIASRNATGVSKGVQHQAAADEFEIGFKDFFAQGFK